jgi:YidC/Oxa1 family membrane protein insertase
MTNEKRFVLFVAIVFLWMMGTNYFFPRRKPAPLPAAADNLKAKDKLLELDLAKAEGRAAGKDDKRDGKKPEAEKQNKDATKKDAKTAVAAAPSKPEIELVKVSELVLGSVKDKTAAGFRIEAQLEQKGAGIYSVYSSRYDAEPEDNALAGMARKRPLRLIDRNRHWPPSLALTLSQGNGAPAAAADVPAVEGAEEDVLRKAAVEAEDTLDSVLWNVVRDENGRTVRSVPGIDPLTKAPITGQAVVFTIKADNGVIVTKTFRLFPNADGLEVDLKFESPDKERSVVYNLLGPHGIPIEGEWYTGTFRDVVLANVSGKEIKINTSAASDVAGAAADSIDNTTLPLAFAGVENQYFAILVQPDPLPTGDQDRRDNKTIALLLDKDEKAVQKSDVGVRITSKPFKIGPNQPVAHTYRVFAGPKTDDALKPYHADGLAIYRKNQWIPLAPQIAQYAIAPILRFTYGVTERVARLFGMSKGNYGIAIILLTLLVRGLMFPIGRKQALAAQKMQLLQPHLKELQEQYKEDKEQLTKETFALYKKHGVNPVAGCLPALIQLPIFVGLWQALNTSFPLRQAPFLWIRDLAAPDMLFRFPFASEVPFLGHWFNVLPFIVVSLMLVQTKLFAPPATTPEAEMQQKMMKYMMIFMGFMFYKVPSGLGIYFITSSLWAIGERLLLPKITHAQPALDAGGPSTNDGADKTGSKGLKNGFGMFGGGKGNGDGNGAKVKAPGRIAQFMERVMEEARKDQTYRNIVEQRDGKPSSESRDRDKDRPRPKPRKR